LRRFLVLAALDHRSGYAIGQGPRFFQDADQRNDDEEVGEIIGRRRLSDGDHHPSRRLRAHVPQDQGVDYEYPEELLVNGPEPGRAHLGPVEPWQDQQNQNGAEHGDHADQLGNNSASDGSYVQMWQPTGQTWMDVRIRQDATTTEDISVQLTTDMVIGTWYHIVVTVNFTTSTLRVYQDGTQVGADLTPTSTTQMATDGPFDLGSYRDGASNFFDGSLDETAWWNRAITSAEVIKINNSGIPLAFSLWDVATTEGFEWGTIIQTSYKPFLSLLNNLKYI